MYIYERLGCDWPITKSIVGVSIDGREKSKVVDRVGGFHKFGFLHIFIKGSNESTCLPI